MLLRAAPLAFALAFIALQAKAADPQRIVSAGGDLTEIVYALGHGDRLVGADSTSTYPVEARALPQVGYVRRLAAEGVISLAPDLVLAADDAGPASTMELLAEAGVRILAAPETDTVDDVPEKVRFVGKAIGDAAGGEALADQIAADVSNIREAVNALTSKPKVLFILSVRGGAPLVGGAGTSAHTMISEAGAINVASALDGWKPMNSEAIIAAAPEIIVMTSAHSERLGGLDEVLARPDISHTPAGKALRGASLDAMMLLGMGPRVAKGIEELARAVHPPAKLKEAGL